MLTVLILAAGQGRRMGPFSRMVPKALIPYDNKPLISHIIEKFDYETTNFVIACGYMGQLIKDYVIEVHKDKKVVFVDIDNYVDGPTGPATTIQMCADHIRGGFLWITCDTLFDFDITDKCDHNWIGVYPVDSTISQDYCWVERNGENITKVYNKVASKHAVDAFIGLMYAVDDNYLNNLIERNAKETPEGFNGLELKAHTVRGWKDFGTYDKWEELSNELVDVSFPKPNELFYSDNGQVIKFWITSKIAETRVLRAQCNLGAMPTNVRQSGPFLIHDYAEGKIVYDQYTLELFSEMLDWCKTSLWKPAPRSDNSNADHLAICHKFYYDKTMERVNMFRTKYMSWSEPWVVNGVEVETIEHYLDKVDWPYLCLEHSWTFIHGDLHFDNTIYNPDAYITEPRGKFTAIDWRTEFGGELYGDQYYDLAKLLGGMWLSYKDIKSKNYSYKEVNDCAILEIPSIHNATLYENMLEEWVNLEGLDWRKVKLLVPLIYLNMSPLHEAPFDKFLVALAQLHFSKVL